ncbi:zinc finger CCCH domain-containing protein 25 [Aristolochia californica]|uniref:zinc finger CCCH domain-containing protein 25 n=1 Tax=Aristolochia californica TaxID=171875 RepID=UPI0035E26B42
MNPLTLVKRIQKINSTEAALGISEDASWHTKYKDSAYVYVGGIPYDLTEGDLLAVFSQYGEIVDVNLVRDKATGKSKGFAFLAYEDQRSTVLAVDNLNGAKVLGRIVRVDHVTKYKRKEEEDEEAEQQKREARGVCRAFQRGDCARGASCKFSHDEQRSANTGWGAKDDSKSRWGHDKYDGPPKSHEKSSYAVSDNNLDSTVGHRDSLSRSAEFDAQKSRTKGEYGDGKSYLKEKDKRELEKRSERHEKEDVGRSRDERRSGRHEKEDQGRSRDERLSGRHEKEDQVRNRDERLSGRHEKEDQVRNRDERLSGKHEKEDQIRSRDERRSGRHQEDANQKQDREQRGSRHNTDTYMKEDHGYRSRYDEDKVGSDWEGENIQRSEKRSRHDIDERDL